MSEMGVKIDQFDVPVCNSFEAKLLNDQLCYEVDLNKFSDKKNIEKELEIGFNFLMDYNKDRQVILGQSVSKMELGLGKNVAASDHNKHAYVYLNTIGRNDFKIFRIKQGKQILQRQSSSLERENTISMQ